MEIDCQVQKKTLLYKYIYIYIYIYTYIHIYIYICSFDTIIRGPKFKVNTAPNTFLECKLSAPSLIRTLQSSTNKLKRWLVFRKLIITFCKTSTFFTFYWLKLRNSEWFLGSLSMCTVKKFNLFTNHCNWNFLTQF